MDRKYKILIIVVVVLVVLVFAFAVGMAVVVANKHGSWGGSDKVALIRVEGVITSGRGGSGIFGEGGAGAERIVKILKKFGEDDSTKAAVIRINSPGGSAAGSQEVYEEIMRLRLDGKKIVISMGDVAASGGYYIASAADKIYADPASLTGSIGVIMETTDLQDLFQKIGVKMDSIKSGPHKDMGSPSRPLTAEERKILQSLINDVFDQFVTDVSNGRKLPKAEVLKLADGRVFTGRQAVKLKLVDDTGSLEDAIRGAAKAAGIKGKPTVIEYERTPGLFEVLFGNMENSRFPGQFPGSAVLGELAQRLLRADSQLDIR